MQTFPLLISSPDGDLFQGEAVMLTLRTPQGEMSVLARHIPLLASVTPCECRIHLPDGRTRRARIGEESLLAVEREGVTLLTGDFSFTGEEEGDIPA